MSSTQFFSENYKQAAERFQSAVLKSKGKFEALNLKDKDLQIGTAYFGPESPKHLILHSTGLHGVEAYVGSAIQLKILDRGFDLPNDTGILLIHCMNPYGMKQNRRFNENNVDLNRNFIDELDSLPRNEQYNRIARLLNPQKPKELKNFKLKAMLQIARKGFATLQQAVAQGQYEHPEGLFYGGDRIEEGPSLVLAYLESKFGSITSLAGLDVHSGLGKFNQEQLFLEGNFSQEQHKRLETCYGSQVEHVQLNAKNSYEISGGWIQRVALMYGNQNVHMLTQEFGVNSPLNVLKALRRENWAYHHSQQNRLQYQLDLKHMFCPESEVWRSSSLDNGVKRFLDLLKFKA